MLNINFLEKVLGLVSPPHFMYDFSRKVFLMFFSINWQNFIPWFLLLQLFVNETATDLSFLSSRFATWPKGQGKKLNIVRTKRAFEVKKAFSITFKGFLLAKNCLRPESVALKISQILQQKFSSNKSFYLMKLQIGRLENLLKRYSKTGAFLWNLQNF